MIYAHGDLTALPQVTACPRSGPLTRSADAGERSERYGDRSVAVELVAVAVVAARVVRGSVPWGVDDNWWNRRTVHTHYCGDRSPTTDKVGPSGRRVARGRGRLSEVEKPGHDGHVGLVLAPLAVGVESQLGIDLEHAFGVE